MLQPEPHCLRVLYYSKSFLGEPLQCFMPANYEKVLLVLVRTLLNSTVSELVSVTLACTAQSWEKYAESYCFIQQTYYVAWEDDIPMESEKRTRRLAYYQWVRHRHRYSLHCPRW